MAAVCRQAKINILFEPYLEPIILSQNHLQNQANSGNTGRLPDSMMSIH
jgi:hypothetical protein